ncbi:MAG: hypothetical protein K2Y22_01830 [Candidatus Obscuribacterales bacterium]|nr:hypothetical protein [Candidatus Obscuribacterales bacterium]
MRVKSAQRVGILIAVSCYLSVSAFAHESASLKAIDASPNTLRGEVSLDASPDPITKYINDLTDAALNQDQNMAKINKYVERFKGFKHSLVHRSKDALNYVFLYKGVSQSSEASDIILDEKQKLKGRSSAEYLRQKLIDKTDIDITKAVLELAMGLGNSDANSGAEEIKSASNRLNKLVGEQKTAETVDFLKKVVEQNPVAEDTWQQKPWSISQKSDREKYLADVSVETDPVSQQIVGYLHKYNNVSKLNRGSQKLVRTTLSLASLSPTLVAPAAQAAIFAWVMASGGSEEDKLLKEVYLGKSLECRSKAISEKANIAIESYQMSLMTKNPALLQCSRSLIKRMGGDANVNNVLSGGTFVAQKPVKDEDITVEGEEPKRKKLSRKEKREAKKAMREAKNKTASRSIDEEHIQ